MFIDRKNPFGAMTTIESLQVFTNVTAWLLALQLVFVLLFLWLDWSSGWLSIVFGGWLYMGWFWIKRLFNRIGLSDNSYLN